MTKAHDRTELSPNEVRDRVWEKAKSIDFCMFVTWDGERQRARPMSARVRREEHAIYFLVDVEGEKNSQIDRFPIVTLTFTDKGANDYIALTGRATINNDRVKIADLWSDFDKAWWEDENDPSIRLITVILDDAELWDGPNSALATVKMMVAAVTGVATDQGDNAKVKM
jgi:general stress protein 26